MKEVRVIPCHIFTTMENKKTHLEWVKRVRQVTTVPYLRLSSI